MTTASRQDGLPAVYIGKMDYEDLQRRGRVTATLYNEAVGNASNEVRLCAAQPLPVQGVASPPEGDAEILADRLASWAADDALMPDPHVRSTLRQAARALAAHPKAQPAPEPMGLMATDAMALTFHRATSDGSLDSEGLADIKAGLNAVLCNLAVAAGRADAQPADMFWDASDGEVHGEDVQEIVDNYAPGKVIRIDCAKRLPSVRVRVLEQGYEVLAARAEPKPEICGNCDTELPGGCGGIFKDDGTACKFVAARAEKGGT